LGWPGIGSVAESSNESFTEEVSGCFFGRIIFCGGKVCAIHKPPYFMTRIYVKERRNIEKTNKHAYARSAKMDELIIITALFFVRH
jgi:hypothetical protein